MSSHGGSIPKGVNAAALDQFCQPKHIYAQGNFDSMRPRMPSILMRLTRFEQ